MLKNIILIAFCTIVINLNSMKEETCKKKSQMELESYKKITEDIERKLNCNFVSDAQFGRSKIIKQAIKLGIYVNTCWQSNGDTALILASAKGHLGIVKMLINAKVDVNKANDDNTTALHEAIDAGHFIIAKLLVKSGVDVNAYSFHMGYPLHLAINKRNNYFVKFLLDNGANLLQKHKGETALQLAERLHRQDQEEEKEQQDRDFLIMEKWMKLEPEITKLNLLLKKNILRNQSDENLLTNIVNEYLNMNDNPLRIRKISDFLIL